MVKKVTYGNQCHTNQLPFASFKDTFKECLMATSMSIVLLIHSNYINYANGNMFFNVRFRVIFGTLNPLPSALLYDWYFTLQQKPIKLKQFWNRITFEPVLKQICQHIFWGEKIYLLKEGGDLIVISCQAACGVVPVEICDQWSRFKIYSQLLRRSTARGSSTGLSRIWGWKDQLSICRD